MQDIVYNYSNTSFTDEFSLIDLTHPFFPERRSLFLDKEPLMGDPYYACIILVLIASSNNYSIDKALWQFQSKGCPMTNTSTTSDGTESKIT